MTKLEFIKEKKTVRDDIATADGTPTETIKVYAIGNYEVIVTIINYNNKVYRTVKVDLTEEASRSNWNDETYIPRIEVSEDFIAGKVKAFKIGTTSYGSMTPDIIEQIVAGYNEALEVVKVLEQNFMD